MFYPGIVFAGVLKQLVSHDIPVSDSAPVGFLGVTLPEGAINKADD